MMGILGSSLDKIGDFYAIPMPKGAMLSWSEAKTYYYQIAGTILLVCVFSYSAVLERQQQDSSSFLAFASWPIVACSVSATIIFAAIVYGYHHRHDIAPSDESRIDLSKAYLGSALAAILAPIVHLMIDYFIA